jgi:hypothetical protein
VEHKYRHTDRWEKFTKYASEMGSGAMIYIPSFIKIGSKVDRGHRHTDSMDIA